MRTSSSFGNKTLKWSLRTCIKRQSFCKNTKKFCAVAETAKKGGYDYFTTTLSISPLKDAERLNSIGGRLAEEYGVQFVYEDFRPLFRDGQDFAREHGFYMQKYCGCVFSEEERYLKKTKIIP